MLPLKHCAATKESEQYFRSLSNETKIEEDEAADGLLDNLAKVRDVAAKGKAHSE